MAKKKPTIKEVVAKVEMLNRVNDTVVKMVTDLGYLIKQYIEFKDDAKDFHEYQKEILAARKKITEGIDNGIK
tara:strand:+ start:6139 stop:6357 length:219 start_codon:yes stop_codon:yes gene_type:complete